MPKFWDRDVLRKSIENWSDEDISVFKQHCWEEQDALKEQIDKLQAEFDAYDAQVSIAEHELDRRAKEGK